MPCGHTFCTRYSLLGHSGRISFQMGRSQWLSYEEMVMLKADLMSVQLCMCFTMTHTPLLCPDPVTLLSVCLEEAAPTVIIFILKKKMGAVFFAQCL